MKFKECLALVRDRPIRITGRIAAEGESSTRYPVLAIRALIAQTRTPIGETTSTRAGEFQVELGVAPPISLHLEIVDANGTVVAGASVDVGETVSRVDIFVPPAALSSARPIERYERDPPLVQRESASALRARVAALVEQERLERNAAAALEASLGPLTWLDDLMPDVRGVLEGRMECAERLRSALLGIGAPPLNAAPVTSVPANDQTTDEAERPDALRLLDRAGLAQLYAAVVWAVEDVAEMQAMLDGLAAALSSLPRLELLLRASAAGETGAMKPLMGGPGPAPGMPPGVPGGPPTIPGSKPKVVPVKIGDLVPDLKVPINQMPSEEEKCLIGAMATVAMKKRQLPQYEISAIDHPAACPGDLVRLTGRNFGLMGSVVFPGSGAGVVAPDVPSWSDTAIRVRVPPGAAPGMIRLSIYEGSLCLCGRLWPIYRLGRTLPMFDGGIPVILEYNVNGATTNLTVEPLATVTVTFNSSVGPGVTVDLVARNGTTVVYNSGSLPGGFHSLSFTSPDVKAPAILDVELSARNHCGARLERFTIRVVKQPRLRILQTEVTQAIQRLDNSVRFAGKRRTMVRVYLDSGLDLFGFAGAPASLPGVTGTVAVWRGSQRLATVQPTNSPFTTGFTLFPYARHNLANSLNFMLPVEHLDGELRLDVNVHLASFPAGVANGPNCTATRTVHVKFEPPRRRSLVRVMLADDWRNLPAPQVSEWQTALLGAMARFPIADDGWDIRLHPGYTVVTVDCDLSNDDGWGDVLEELDDVAGDSSESWDHTWVGLLPAFRSGIDNFTTLGNGRTETTDGLFSNDYLVMAVVAGRPDVFAHELGHTFGIGHANCPAGKPEDVDPALPSYIEQPAVDLYAGVAMPEGVTGELMGYCSAGGLWPSIVTWTRFLDRT